jgi:tetratricopeptide (TPR) repeat protein
VFALHDRQIGPEEAGRMLNVDFIVSGSVRRQGEQLMVMVELAETRTARIVWTETFEHRLDDALVVLDEIGNRIVASIASEIEASERNRAILRPPNSLDAWEAHHRGLWHMYRFNKPDNKQARHFFEMALRLDPTFSRAHAGLSFTHFQDAFQGWAERTLATDLAFDAAGQSLMADDRDPAAHWAMGRALWLRGHHDRAIIELEQTIDLSPNFALGHYTLAFVQSQAGDPRAAILSSDHSRHLSPFDPLLFGMLGARAMALVRLGRFEEAADWGIKAAARPNAHAHILAIAALSLALAGRLDEARSYLAAIHRTLPQYRVSDFLTAMRFAPDGEQLFRDGAKHIGMR